MKISELVYEVRSLARKETDLLKKDLFFQCAKALEVSGNLAKIADLVVAEHYTTPTPSVNKDDEIKWPIDEVTIKALEDHLNELERCNMLEKEDRWPYGADIFAKFTVPVAIDHLQKESEPNKSSEE
jgi:hypothetical protein